MISTISCPGCNGLLKKPADLPAGKRIQCPHCGTAFAPVAEAEAPMGVTAAFQPAVDTAPAAAAPARRIPSGGGRSVPPPPKRFSIGAVLAVLALVAVVLLGGAALAVLAYFGRDWYAPSKPTDAVADPRPTVPQRGGKQQPFQQPLRPAGGPTMRPGRMGRPAIGPVQQPSPPRIGQTAPEITGKDLDGKALKLSDFRGKVVVLDFWGDWCPFCKAAYTYQRQLMQRMEGRSFVLLGVNCDETAEQARLVVKNQRIGWRSWWDGGNDMTGSIYKRWGVQVVPSVFVLDTKGVIRQHFEGAPPEAELDAVVESLLPAEQGRPRWLAAEPLLQQLGTESDLGAYRIRLPRDFVAKKGESEEGRQTWLWNRSTIFNGATYLEVTLRSAAEDKPVDAVEKALVGLPCLRQGWTCTAAQRGEIQGRSFYRVTWSGVERGGKRPMSGFVFAALDGDTLIQIAAHTTEANHSALSLAEAAALTFHKVPK